HQGDGPRAAQIHEALAADHPSIDPATRADAWFRAGEHHRRGPTGSTEAERCFRAALALVPDHLPALDGVERLARDAGDADRLAEVLEQKVATSDRHPARQRALLARLAEHQEAGLGRPDLAVATWNRLASLDPDHRPALRQIVRRPGDRGPAEILALHLALGRSLPGDDDLAAAPEALIQERASAIAAAAEVAAGSGAPRELVAELVSAGEALLELVTERSPLVAALATFHEALGDSRRAAELRQESGPIPAVESEPAPTVESEPAPTVESEPAPTVESDEVAEAPPRRTTDVEAELETAQSLEAGGHRDAAIAHFEATWLANPDDRRPLEQLERLYQASGDVDALSETLGRLLALTSDESARAALWLRRGK